MSLDQKNFSLECWGKSEPPPNCPKIWSPRFSLIKRKISGKSQMNKISQNKIKKIVLYCSAVTDAGGLERLFFEEEKFFRKKGIDTRMLTFFSRQEALYNFDSRKLECLEPHKSKIARLLSLRKKIKQINPDLIIGQTYADGMYLYIATLFTPVRYALHIHGSLFWFPEDTIKYSFLFRRVFHEIRESVAGHKEFIPEKKNCNFVERIKVECLALLNYLSARKAISVFVISNHMKWEVDKLYGIQSVVSHGCLSAEQLHFVPRRNIKRELRLESKKVIFSLSRLDLRKRVDLLIRSFAKLADQYDDIVLMIGGTGAEEARLKEIANGLGINDRVLFLGFIPESELFEYYASCDIFTYPAWRDTGITPYEALACGKKVVWTTEADQPVLNSEYCFIAEPTVDSYAIGMDKALTTEITNKLSLEDYTWDHYFDTIYSSIVENTCLR